MHRIYCATRGCGELDLVVEVEEHFANFELEATEFTFRKQSHAHRRDSLSIIKLPNGVDLPEVGQVSRHRKMSRLLGAHPVDLLIVLWHNADVGGRGSVLNTAAQET